MDLTAIHVSNMASLSLLLAPFATSSKTSLPDPMCSRNRATERKVRLKEGRHRDSQAHHKDTYSRDPHKDMHNKGYRSISRVVMHERGTRLENMS